jgi:hypothetical protein
MLIFLHGILSILAHSIFAFLLAFFPHFSPFHFFHKNISLFGLISERARFVLVLAPDFVHRSLQSVEVLIVIEFILSLCSFQMPPG